MLLLTFLFALCAIAENILVCEDILQDPEDTIYTIDKLKAIPIEEVNKCLLHLGKSEMSEESAKIIWSALLEYYGTASDIPEEKLTQLHWVTKAIQPEEYENITLTSIDVVENFGLFYDLNDDQLSAILSRIREDWSYKQPEDFTSYDLLALKQIVCVFNASEISRIHAESYREAAPGLATLQKCPKESLEALASLALKAFGPADKWDESTITTVGVVMDGLPEGVVSKSPIESSQPKNAETV